MGGGKSKDPNVGIYFEIDKPYYYTGDWVDGNVYIVAKSNLTYKALYLRFQGIQHCRWHQKYGPANVWYMGNRTTYQNEFILSRWDEGLPLGHYIFPFRFQLPEELPGSYIEKNDENFTIRYPLQTYLVDYTNPDKKTDYTYNLTIIEPPRNCQFDLMAHSSTNPKTFFCCPQGNTTMQLKFQKTAVRGGQPIRVQAYIDNTRCKKPIKGVEMYLKKHLFVEAENGCMRNWNWTKVKMKSRAIPSGSVDTIPLQMIPQVATSTAIGSIVANYYMLKIKANVGGCICCCGKNVPEVSQPIYIEVLNPPIAQKKQMEPPSDWVPYIAPKVIYENINQFEYKSNPKLHIMNRQFPEQLPSAFQ